MNCARSYCWGKIEFRTGEAASGRSSLEQVRTQADGARFKFIAREAQRTLEGNYQYPVLFRQRS